MTASRVWRWTSSAAGDEDWRSVCWCHDDKENKKRKVLKAFCIQTAKNKKQNWNYQETLKPNESAGCFMATWVRDIKLFVVTSAALLVPPSVSTWCARVLSRRSVLWNSSDLRPLQQETSLVSHCWPVPPAAVRRSDGQSSAAVFVFLWSVVDTMCVGRLPECCWVCSVVSNTGRKCHLIATEN